jgi:hypothetical protein
MKRLAGICFGIAVSALLIFAVWAVRIEITYRENVRAMTERDKRILPDKLELMQIDHGCRLGEKCVGDRDAQIILNH